MVSRQIVRSCLVTLVHFGFPGSRLPVNVIVFSVEHTSVPTASIWQVVRFDPVGARWVETYSEFVGREGVGAIALDSFTNRKVKDVCGPTEGNWARRRSQDAYSALEFLATTGYADMSRVYLVGRSNGGTTVLMAIERVMCGTDRFRNHTPRWAEPRAAGSRSSLAIRRTLCVMTRHLC